jgi:hypothetical protein
MLESNSSIGVGSPELACDCDGDGKSGGHDHWQVGGMSKRCILTIHHIPNPMKLILNAPMRSTGHGKKFQDIISYDWSIGNKPRRFTFDSLRCVSNSVNANGSSNSGPWQLTFIHASTGNNDHSRSANFMPPVTPIVRRS